MMMTKEDVDYIWEQSRRYRELLAVRQIAIQLRDVKKAAKCRTLALEIQNELYQKYKVII